MKQIQANYPQLRFKGFTDTWKEKKLGEFTDSYSGGTPKISNSGFYDGNIPFIRSAEVHRCKTELFLSEDGINNSSAKLVKKGDILYALYGATSGEVGISKIDGAINQAILCIKTNSKNNNVFLSTWLGRQKDKITNEYIQGGQGNLSGTIIKRLLVPLPSLSEQQAIGTFFTKLDALITAQQQKVDKLKRLKRGYLQQLFPQGNANVPRLRFNGFIGAWEEKKLGKVVDFFSGLTYKPSNVQQSGTLVLRSSNIQNGEIVSADDVFVNPTVVNSEYVQTGDIIVVVRNGSKKLIGKHAVIKNNNRNCVIGAFMTGIRYKNFGFINALLTTSVFTKEIHEDLGATINQITMREFKSMKFAFPNKDEQQAIGSFFTKLGTLIIVQQRKLDRLKELKKGYLQEMFC